MFVLILSQKSDIRNSEVEVKRYFAWVFFVIGAVNTLGAAIKHSAGEMPTLSGSPGEALSVLVFLFFAPLCLYLWWRWK